MLSAEERTSLSSGEIRDAVRDAVARHLDLESHEIFIFGSEARGTSTRRSDIDVGILGPQPVPLAAIRRIRDELEKILTLRLFDVVDLSSADVSFRQTALRDARKL
jgi:predicted nucleotidyltransferase